MGSRRGRENAERANIRERAGRSRNGPAAGRLDDPTVRCHELDMRQRVSGQRRSRTPHRCGEPVFARSRDVYPHRRIPRAFARRDRRARSAGAPLLALAPALLAPVVAQSVSSAPLPPALRSFSHPSAIAPSARRAIPTYAGVNETPHGGNLAQLREGNLRGERSGRRARWCGAPRRADANGDADVQRPGPERARPQRALRDAACGRAETSRDAPALA